MAAIIVVGVEFSGNGMRITSLVKQTVGVGLLLLSGCEVARSARDDLARLTGPSTTPSQVRKSTPPKPQPAAQAASVQAASIRPGASASTVEASAAAAPPDRVAAAQGTAVAVPGTDDAAVLRTGTGERELRAMLGPPTSEEDHPPGKQWRYRDGKCTIDIQLYPDVETKQFGTLAYKVKSDDNTDEGRRLCVAQLQSRVQARR